MRYLALLSLCLLVSACVENAPAGNRGLLDFLKGLGNQPAQITATPTATPENTMSATPTATPVVTPTVAPDPIPEGYPAGAQWGDHVCEICGGREITWPETVQVSENSYETRLRSDFVVFEEPTYARVGTYVHRAELLSRLLP